MARQLGRMLDDGRRAFDLACSAYLHGAEHAKVLDALVKTDLGINSLEREIRRSLVVHATVHGVFEFPACLVLMSVTKDAEQAATFIEVSEELKDECDDRIDAILAATESRNVEPAEPAAAALCYRYFKRVTSHAGDVVTSLVVSVDRLDYFDESDETRN